MPINSKIRKGGVELQSRKVLYTRSQLDEQRFHKCITIKAGSLASLRVAHLFLAHRFRIYVEFIDYIFGHEFSYHFVFIFFKIHVLANAVPARAYRINKGPGKLTRILLKGNSHRDSSI